MKKYFAIGAAVAVLAGTAAFLLKTEHFSLAIRDQLSDGNPAADTAKSASLSQVKVSGITAAPDTGTPVTPKSATGLAAVAEQGEENVDITAYLKAPPLSEKEKKNMSTLLSTFFKGDRGKASMNHFIEELDANGLEPIVAKDENPYTGKMVTIRTKEALEGTRYLHAQYFQDESANQEPFRQHISFEVRPSPDCMQVARGMMESLVGKALGAPISASNEWTEWKVDGHSVWIKRLGKDDIANNPFNARTLADVGSCWIAKEMMPDEHEDKATRIR